MRRDIRHGIWFLTSLFFTTGVKAELTAANDVSPLTEITPPDMLSLFQLFGDSLGPLMVKLSVILGGIFGVYLLLLLVKIHYERKKVRLLQDIRYNFDQLNKHYGISSFDDKIGFLKRVFRWLKKGNASLEVAEKKGKKQKK